REEAARLGSGARGEVTRATPSKEAAKSGLFALQHMIEKNRPGNRQASTVESGAALAWRARGV
ncbi:hypothetical protein L7Q78_44935, partial [Achromobacter xylosoxidans]|nr:hypothetical protein [Achromobacter xylosoxidans]